MTARDPNARREEVLLALGCVITVAWVAAVIVEVMLPKHEVPTAVHAVMLVLVPLLFGGAAFNANKQKP